MKTFFTRNTTHQLSFKFLGDWTGTVEKLRKLDPVLKVATVKAQENMALIIMNKVLGHLQKQDLPWKKLNKRYKANKQKDGWDHRILLATHSYFENIGFWKRQNGWHVFIGVKPGVYGKSMTGKKPELDIATIAYIHEFSQNEKRRRPLWNPTIRELGNTPGIKKLYLTELHKQLKKHGLTPLIKKLKSF